MLSEVNTRLEWLSFDPWNYLRQTLLCRYILSVNHFEEIRTWQWATERDKTTLFYSNPIVLNIPFPRALDMKGDLANNWKHFKSVWKNYEVATGLHEKDDNLRCATFLTCRKRWNNWNAKRSVQDWIAWGKGKCWAWNPDVFSFSWGTSCARWTCL